MPTIGEFTIGADRDGLETYIRNLKFGIFDDTIRIIEEGKPKVLDVIAAGWQGESYQAFSEDLETKVADLRTELERERDDMEQNIRKVGGAYFTIDKNLYQK